MSNSSDQPPNVARAPTRRDVGAAFDRLVEIMRLLRSPTGCPWDREQTYESLRPFVLEEAYEVVDAIDRGDLSALAGEVGDLVFEGVFLAQIASEEGAFSIVDAIERISDKLVRRHPHVFGRPSTSLGTGPSTSLGGADTGGATTERAIDTPAAVVDQWERIKAKERQAGGGPGSLLGGVPRALPALLRAYEIGVRVGTVGFDWPTPAEVLTKVREELIELQSAIDAASREKQEEELGDLLFSVAQLARKLGIEPESAMRRANDKFTRRFTAVESRIRRDGTSLHDTPLDAMEAHWRAVKDEE